MSDNKTVFEQVAEQVHEMMDAAAKERLTDLVADYYGDNDNAVDEESQQEE